MKFQKQCKIKLKRVLYIALSILLLSPSGVVSAATADDLREIIGDRRVTDNTLIQDMRSIVYKYQKSQYQKELIELLHELGDFGYEEKFNSLIKEKENALQVLETSFKSNEEVKIVISYMNDVITVLDKLGALQKEDSYILDSFGEHDEEEAYQYAISVMDSVNDTFDLGNIGQGLEPPTQVFVLKRPFGEIIIPGKNIKTQENKGIDLYVTQNIVEETQVKIVSQFHGVVKDIVKLENGTYRIIINHGKSVQTIYENLSDIQVKEGTVVKQYELIGYASGDTIHFEVLLNTLPINPLFLYGKAGEYVYENWFVSNPGMSSNRLDFSNVKESYSNKDVENEEANNATEKFIENIIEDSVEGIVDVEDNYEIPKRQIIDSSEKYKE